MDYKKIEFCINLQIVFEIIFSKNIRYICGVVRIKSISIDVFYYRFKNIIFNFELVNEYNYNYDLAIISIKDILI